MSQKSDYLEGKIIEHVLRNVAYTSPTTVYCALYTATPSDAGGGTEVSGNGYARQAVTFGAHSGGVCTNSAAITFPVDTTANWGTITSFGIFDALTVGNLLYWGALTASQVVNVGNQLQFAIGALSVGET